LSEAELPLYDNLPARGLVCTDDLDLGLSVHATFTAIGSDRAGSNCVHAIAPPLEGSLWETTAVPDLRGRALRVAETILEREPATTTKTHGIEYSLHLTGRI
jgi:uncharacterized NAD(P)/FAD-binding protein YdhS